MSGNPNCQNDFRLWTISLNLLQWALSDEAAIFTFKKGVPSEKWKFFILNTGKELSGGTVEKNHRTWSAVKVIPNELFCTCPQVVVYDNDQLKSSAPKMWRVCQKTHLTFIMEFNWDYEKRKEGKKLIWKIFLWRLTFSLFIVLYQPSKKIYKQIAVFLKVYTIKKS